MAIVGLDTILANQGAVQTQEKSSKELGAEEFFTLLCTELQYQDPMDPMENTEYTAMLAQFSTLESQLDMTNSMSEISQLAGSINNMSALNFVGKEVNATGNVVYYDGEATDLTFELDDAAVSVKVTVYDDSGAAVREMEMENVAEGQTTCAWDGLDSRGQEVEAGRYVFSVKAYDAEGYKVSGRTFSQGTVTGVRYDGGITYLMIGDKEVTISDIETIKG